MNIGKQNYPKYADAHAPRSRLARDSFRAFLVGGLICAVGEGLNILWGAWGVAAENRGLLTSTVIVLAAVVLTAADKFDDIAKFAGAGTFLPITGFANSVASPAIDARDEGWILGIGAKVFTVAGPVLLYGTLAGTLWGVVYFVITLFR